MRLLHGHDGPVHTLAFSPDGSRLASGGKDGTVREWLGASTSEAVVKSFTGPIGSIAISEANGLVIGGRLGADYFCASVERAIAPGPVSSVAFCDGGRYIVAGRGDQDDAASAGSLVLINTATFRPVREFFPDTALAVAATPLGKRIIWGGIKKRVNCWNVTDQEPKQSAAHTRPVRALALSPDAGTFAAADDYAIRVYNADTMQEQRQLTGHKGRVDALAFTPAGRLLSGAWDKTVRLWDTVDGRLLATHDWGVGNIRTVAVSPDGLLAAAAGDRGVIVVWDMEG